MNAKTLLAAAIAALLLSAPVADVDAQSVSRETRPATDAPAEDAEDDKPKRKAKKNKEAADEDGPKFPNASREEPPKIGKGSKLQAKLTKLDRQFRAEEYAEIFAGAEEVLADPKATAGDRAMAAYFAAFAAINTDDDHVRAQKYTQRAIEENALSNDVHFQLMQQQASMHLADEQYAEAIAVMDRFLAETKSDDVKAHAMRGNALYRLERYAEAIDALKSAIPADGKPEKAVVDMLVDSYLQTDRTAEALAMAETLAGDRADDKRAQLNLATVYAQADQPAKAVEVFERLRSAGMLTEASDYESGYRLLASLDGREKDTIAFINEGLTKGILKPSPSVYSLLGQSYYFSDQMSEAIAAWEKGAPLAKDGELYLNLAKANLQVDRYAAAKAAAQQAIAKGVRKPGDAWIVVAGAEQGLGNDAGIVAAYREAAKDPATREQAQKMLRSLGAK